jgi:hypothetical protein
MRRVTATTQGRGAMDPAAPRRPGAAGRGHGPVFLELQRAAGNRAVTGFIQRKFGFEAELQINTFGPEQKSDDAKKFKRGALKDDGDHDGKECPPEVANFLVHGLPYNEPHGQNDSFFLKPDHGESSLAVGNLFNMLSWRGFAPNPDDVLNAQTVPSNLEYASKAIDELAPGSTAQLEKQVKDVQQHVDAIFKGRPRERIFEIPAPAEKMWTGVPVQALKDWLGPAFTNELIQGELKALQDALQDSFYLQVTAGIIPSALPELYKKDALAHAIAGREDAAGPPRVYAAMAMNIYEVMHDLATYAKFKNHTFVKGLTTVESEALLGLLHLAYSYVVGTAVNLTDAFPASTEKNAVPFLAHMHWPTLRDLALPEKVRPQNVPDDLVRIVGLYFANQALSSPSGWVHAGLGLKHLPESEAKTRSSLMGGDGVENFVERLFGLHGEDEAFVPFAFGKEWTGDEQRPEVQKVSGGQLGIPLERRFIADRPSSQDLLGVLKGFLKEARELNTRHLEDKGSALIKAADGPAVASGAESKDKERKQ